MTRRIASAARPEVDAEHALDALATFVNTEIMARDHGVAPDDDLDAAGVDSVAYLKILLFIETTFGFWMPDEDLLDANVRSLRALASYVCRRLGPAR
jgi:acyl carrier protein